MAITSQMDASSQTKTATALSAAARRATLATDVRNVRRFTTAIRSKSAVRVGNAIATEMWTKTMQRVVIGKQANVANV